MEEDIKNDLAGIAFTHPFFSGIVNNTLVYIEQLEERNKELKKENKELKERYQRWKDYAKEWERLML